MKLKNLKIKGFKNLTGKNGWFELNFADKNGVTVLIGNNGSGKSNVLEAISAIFAGLYDKKLRPKFSYELEYEIREDKVKIEYKYHNGKIGIKKTGSKNLPFGFQGKLKVTTFKVNGNSVLRYNDYLPSQVIAGYSGEETRLYERYYLPFYESFIKDIVSSKKSISENCPMTFISKDHWNIALLTMAVSGTDMSEIIADKKIDKIILKYNEKNVEKFNSINPNEVTGFVKALFETKDLDLEKIKELPLIETHKKLYKLLSVALLPKESSFRLIESMKLIFDNSEMSSFHLSEGEKKQILIYFILQVLADKNSLVLLDEPDSYIHVGNKERIKKFFEKFLKDYGEGEIILTTHSPTLMHHFDDSSLVYLDNGKIVKNERADILKQITGDLMSYSEQQIVLNTSKDILILEGKTDGKYIKTALEKLKPDNQEYSELSFEFLYIGGSDPELLNELIGKFPPKKGQTIIAFLDRDKSGFDCIKEVCGYSGEKDSFNGDVKNYVYIYFFPKKAGFTKSNFEIEDYFDINKCRDFAFGQIETMENLKSKFKKNSFANKCNDFNATDFEGFKKLFDLIIKIKDDKILENINDAKKKPRKS